MRITLSQLREADACEDQYNLFQEKFGEYVDVTTHLCMIHAQDFDWQFAADHFLTGPAIRAYNERITHAIKAYDEDLNAAWRDLHMVDVSLREACNEMISTAPTEIMNEIRAIAQEIYEKETERAHYRCMRKESMALHIFNHKAAIAFANAAALVK